MVKRTLKKGRTRDSKTWTQLHGLKGIGPLKKGDLTKYDYKNVKKLSAKVRHNALKRAVRVYGPLTLFRKLNAVYIYNKNTNKTVSRIFKRDRDWVKKTFMKK